MTDSLSTGAPEQERVAEIRARLAANYDNDTDRFRAEKYVRASRSSLAATPPTTPAPAPTEPT